MSGRPSWHREGRGRIARNAKTLFLMGSVIGISALSVAGALACDGHTPASARAVDVAFTREER